MELRTVHPVCSTLWTTGAVRHISVILTSARQDRAFRDKSTSPPPPRPPLPTLLPSPLRGEAFPVYPSCWICPVFLNTVEFVMSHHMLDLSHLSLHAASISSFPICWIYSIFPYMTDLSRLSGHAGSFTSFATCWISPVFPYMLGLSRLFLHVGSRLSFATCWSSPVFPYMLDLSRLFLHFGSVPSFLHVGSLPSFLTC